MLVQFLIFFGETASAIVRNSERFADEKRERLGDMTTHVQECLQGQATVREYQHQGAANAAFGSLAGEYRRASLRAFVYGECLYDVIVGGNVLLQAGILATGVVLVPRGAITAGDVLSLYVPAR
eukprot:tig00000139_g8303.t1